MILNVVDNIQYWAYLYSLKYEDIIDEIIWIYNNDNKLKL